jgi:hypothetical protein
LENISSEIKGKHINFKECQECRNKFSKKNKKAFHHDHISGQYINTLCNTCNLKYQYKPFLPILCHNLKGYDSHFIIPLLNKYGKKGEVSCIASNEEKFMSFSKSIQVGEYICKKTKEMKPVMFEIRFLDSLGFMNSSLDKLSQNLAKGNNTTDELRKVFKNVSKAYPIDEQFREMLKKGIYPYDHIQSYEILNQNTLPSRRAFYSKLSNKKCGKEEYQQAEKVWKLFNCKTFMDYHNLYLTSDVLILADVWENFKLVCKKIYGLDCSYYYTAPGLSWDAWLKHTNEESLKIIKKSLRLNS